MSDEITQNLVQLSEKIKNLKSVLEQLESNGIVSKNESEYILSGKSSLDRNSELLALIGRKDWEKVKSVFKEILRNTGNSYSALLIENGSLHIKKKVAPILGCKWWPIEKNLPSSFQPRNHGEQLLIEEIRNSLVSEETHTIALTGLPAIGKTATAISYAKHYAGEYDQIIWIYRMPFNYLHTTCSFYYLLCELDNNNCHNREPEDWVKKSFSLLADVKCLFIYDNAKCLKGKDGIQNILPKNNPNFHAIVTSRDTNWNFTSIKLNFLSLNESLQLLKNNLSPDIIYEEDELVQLCNLLDNWPLALQIAKETLNSKEVNLRAYIERVKYSDEIIRLYFGEYPFTLSEVIKISLDQISDDRGNDSDICKFILALGYIQADNVTYDFLSDIMSVPSRQLEPHLKFLEKQSLLSRNEKIDNGQEVKTVSIPRLVQKVIRNYDEDPEETLTKLFSRSRNSSQFKTIELYTFAIKSTYYKSDLCKMIIQDFKSLVKNEKNEAASQLAQVLCAHFNEIKTKDKYKSFCPK